MEISHQFSQKAPHSLVYSNLLWNVNIVLVFCWFFHAFSRTEHPNKRTITDVRFNKRIDQQPAIYLSLYYMILRIKCSVFDLGHKLGMCSIKSRLLSTVSTKSFPNKLLLMIISSHERLQRLFPYLRIIIWHFLGFKTKKLS